MIPIRTHDTVMVGATGVPVTMQVTGTPGPVYLAIAGMPQHRADQTRRGSQLSFRDSGFDLPAKPRPVAVGLSRSPGSDGVNLANTAEVLAATAYVIDHARLSEAICVF